jgi:RNA polymerase sigma-70 factor (ECF subfamily)
LLNSEEQLDVGNRLRNGDRTAWDALYQNYSVAVWRLTARLVGSDAAGVADVVQEVFLAAAASARRFDPEQGTLWSWLAGITHRQVSNYWRKAERADRWRASAESGRIDVASLLESDETPEDILEQREVADLVRRVLADLSTDYAMLLTSKYLDDRSLEDLAAETGISVEATKSKLARARREFRAAFELLVGSDQGARLL